MFNLMSSHKQELTLSVEQSRDSRFLPLAGEFSAENFQAQYDFLADAHKVELENLQENLKRAREVTCPRNLFDERDQEAKRLDLAVRRAGSMVNKHRKNMTEREALLKLTREKKEKRKKGKKHWCLKECKYFPNATFLFLFNRESSSRETGRVGAGKV
jgi:ribosomal RNA-processing protein 36